MLIVTVVVPEGLVVDTDSVMPGNQNKLAFSEMNYNMAQTVTVTAPDGTVASGVARSRSTSSTRLRRKA